MATASTDTVQKVYTLDLTRALATGANYDNLTEVAAGVYDSATGNFTSSATLAAATDTMATEGLCSGQVKLATV